MIEIPKIIKDRQIKISNLVVRRSPRKKTINLKPRMKLLKDLFIEVIFVFKKLFTYKHKNRRKMLMGASLNQEK